MMYEVMMAIEGQEEEKSLGIFERVQDAESAMVTYRATCKHAEAHGGERTAFWISEIF